ncbi:MAG TPA: LD-carboxypeptidase [Thermoanaerobaculia bacterium]|nr:LD-carboxypeptidase [Thermoanaerobaculia bacterium]
MHPSESRISTSARLPPPTGPGDRIGVAALSGPVDAERLERGLAELRRLGFEPVLAANLASRTGLFAGGDAERLAAFHRLAAYPDLPAIVFARGGHGVLRLLPAIDWDLLGRRPRAYVGYSDLTPLLLEIVRRLGLVAFHGPMVAADAARGLAPAEEESLLGALAGRYPSALPFASWLRRGDAAGPLLGGCLSMLAATLGTPFFPELGGALLFWEEIGEAPYRIDRMLTHLRLSGNLAAIQGMIVGHLRTAAVDPAAPLDLAAERAEPASDTWGPALVAESLSAFEWPLAWGLASGHLRPNLTLPLGLQSRLQAGSTRLELG